MLTILELSSITVCDVYDRATHNFRFLIHLLREFNVCLEI